MVPSLRNYLQRSLLFASLVKMMSIFKVSYVLGYNTIFFSAAHALFPLTGAFGGLLVTALSLIMSMFIHYSIGGISAPFLITYHIPGIFASAYWAYNHWSTRAAVPLLCMVLFAIHPHGLWAAGYTLFWLIPIMVHVFGARSIFVQSLASTFVAHAVGSVIWLYTVPMTTAQWYALMPIVVLERLLFAGAMTVAYYALVRVFALSRDRSKQASICVPAK